ncbi:MAG: single-stranded-DNA-specific exonuclease RecJ [Clostridia bacterium]|nr:single-stranded-DNA-specific exonuclease RecJ [Clostridia bacterium]
MNGSKKWVIKEQDETLVKALSEALDVKEITARLLINRGYTDEKRARAFLEKSDSFLHDPFLMKDMEKAVARVLLALERGEKITVYGDYDVDGITSVSIIYIYLASLGASVDYYIPSRDTDGYGLNNSAIDAIAARGTSLIITVDTGITAIEETEYIKSLGLDVVITDHHHCRPELPAATAVVNPQREDCTYPFKELSGVGVAFKLLCAVELTLKNGGKYSLATIKDMCRRYIDIVTIGTIADVMPLVDENRIIVYMGLSLLENTQKIGVRALFEAAGIEISKKDRRKITSSVIGFTIAPRINATGRIGSAERAVKLFIAEHKEEAEALAEEFCIINKERQDTETEILQEVIREIEEKRMHETDTVLVLAGDNWHHGVIGIVCSRITEKYNLPSILISFDACKDAEVSGENVGKGSARSIKGVNLAESLAANAEFLEKYGGHELAAGLSIKRGNIDAFRKAINEYASEQLGGKKPEVSLEVEASLSLGEVNIPNIDDTMRLEPFGAENPQPLFALENVRIADMVPLSGGKHTKMFLTGEKGSASALFFGADLKAEGFEVGDIVSVAASLNVNEFRGDRTPQLICRDIVLVEKYVDEVAEAVKYFEDVYSGAELINSEDIPVRGEFAVVYKFLKRIFPYGGGTVSIKRISAECGVSYIKILCIFRAFFEGDIIKYDRISNFDFRITILPTEGKSDLNKTEIMKVILNKNK